ncbi:10627_t:CDS:2 [Ambispora gerdemannii]|uniref:10627_t:CDS:1 n=1 Tax=Ambispora gerdemannii TaxID=144530 RepID=A0A9N9CBU0_9GLOM|nr:10627_t:CDS:2 [Ambispora gerdemannii]
MQTERKLLNEPPYDLTLTIEELTKPANKKRDNSDYPPRPQNSWIIFRKDYEASLHYCSPNVRQEVKRTTQECSLMWRQLSSEVKHYFKILEKIACENHKRIYPNYKYKPRNAKDSNIKKWVFREQKKYMLPMSSSMSDNLSQEIVRSPSLNDIILTTKYNHTIITASTIIDDTHPSTSNTNNDAGNSVNNASNEITLLDQFLLSRNVEINVNNADSATIDDTYLSTINTSNDVGNSFNNAFNEIISLDQFPFLSDTTIDDIHPSTINTETNNDVRNSVNDMSNEIISLDQFPFLPGNVDINDEFSIAINTSIDDNSQPNQIRHQPLISLPSLINANSPALPSTNNDDSLLINTGEIDNDIWEIIAKYYVLDDMNDIGDISNSLI